MCYPACACNGPTGGRYTWVKGTWDGPVTELVVEGAPAIESARLRRCRIQRGPRGTEGDRYRRMADDAGLPPARGGCGGQGGATECGVDRGGTPNDEGSGGRRRSAAGALRRTAAGSRMSGALRDRLIGSGAVYGTVGGTEVVRHYGDPGAEYRAVREAAGFAQRSDRARIRMWGRDPRRMLNGLITNDLALLAPDRAVYAAMLTPKGRVISDLRAFPLDEGELGVDLPLDALPAV